jgi:hypothetical protein
MAQRWILCAAQADACQPCMSYDFVSAFTHDGRRVRLLNLIDEHPRECLLIRAERRWTSAKVSKRWPTS